MIQSVEQVCKYGQKIGEGKFRVVYKVEDKAVKILKETIPVICGPFTFAVPVQTYTYVKYGIFDYNFAEYMVLNSAASVGDLVSLNSSGEYQLAVAGQSLIGVVSDNPAFVGNANLEGTSNAYVVGFAGVIETTVSDANGPIPAGIDRRFPFL